MMPRNRVRIGATPTPLKSRRAPQPPPRATKGLARGPPDLSIVAAYDELVRNANVLAIGSEKEFAEFVGKAGFWIKRWRECEVSREQLAKVIKEKEKEILAKDYKIKQANNLWSNERNGRLLAEAQRDELTEKLQQLKDILVSKEVGKHLDNETLERVRRFDTTSRKKSEMARLPAVDESAESILDVSEFSFDETKEDHLGESRLRNGHSRYKRRSSGKYEAACKKRKSRSVGNKLDEEVSEKILQTTTKVSVDHDGNARAESFIEALPVAAGDLRKKARKSRESRGERRVTYNERKVQHDYSPSAPPCPPEEVKRFVANGGGGSPMNYGSPAVRRHISNAGSIPNRPHVWETKTSSMSSRCGPCGQRIGFSKKYLKCKDCQAICHLDCRLSVPLPCVVATSRTPTKGQPPVLADFAPRDPPYIPAILRHCLREIEDRGLDEIGIYRIPGNETETNEVLEKFMKGKGGAPILSKYEIHVITSTVKKFLRSLKEPIIPSSLWKTFVDAVNNAIDDTYDEGSLYQAISELPRPNRDTLAFLILHLQRVAVSPYCKMDVDNLSNVWGPTVLGNSSGDPGAMISEVPLQRSVVKALLDVPNDYWERIIQVECDKLFPGLVHTPEDRGERGFNFPSARKTGPIAKRTRSRSRQYKQQFFQSPMLK